MRFLIQKINKEIRHDFSFHLIQAIHFHKWLHPQTKISVRYLNYDPTEDVPEPDDIYPIPFKEIHKGYVPIGSVEFVTEYLQHFYKLTPKPRNIPGELCDIKFAHRGVWRGSADALSFLKDGKYFIKSDTKIKGYSGFVYKGFEHFEPKISNDYYQISEAIDIQSEWRCFVYENKLIGLQNYSGDFTKFPDIHVINNMIEKFKPSAPIAYTLDVGVNDIHTYSDDIGTFVIEVHDFFSCGLYGFSDYYRLPYMFTRWFQEYLKFNLF